MCENDTCQLEGCRVASTETAGNELSSFPIEVGFGLTFIRAPSTDPVYFRWSGFFVPSFPKNEIGLFCASCSLPRFTFLNDISSLYEAVVTANAKSLRSTLNHHNKSVGTRLMQPSYLSS